MSRLYRPLCGSEGMDFIAKFCDHCRHDSEEAPCEILGRTLDYQITEPGYPSEWIQDDNGGHAHCTAFEAKEGQ